MAFISTWPRPPRSASAAPDMPAKIRLHTTLMWAKPPLILPMRVVSTDLNRASLNPPLFIRQPAKIKVGTASMVMELREPPIF